MTRLLRSPVLALVMCTAVASLARAQATTPEASDTTPAFSLSTSQVFTTREAPHFFLTFRRVPQLDVRVYKVRDAFAFFSGLSDPHQLGTDEPYAVPQDRSWI